MSQFVISFQCTIVDVATGQGGNTTLHITIEAADARRATEIAERNLQAAMILAQRALDRQGTP